MCTIQWFWIYSQICTTISIVNFRTFSSSLKHIQNSLPMAHLTPLIKTHITKQPVIYVLCVRFTYAVVS